LTALDRPSKRISGDFAQKRKGPPQEQAACVVPHPTACFCETAAEGVPARRSKASKAGLEALLCNLPASPGVNDTQAVLEWWQCRIAQTRRKTRSLR
jgi:hypothetical protein